MANFITAEAAANLIPDGALVAATGFGLAGWAEEIAQAIESRFVNTGHPNNITLMHAAGIGDWKERGTTHLGKEGLIKRWIGAHVGASFGITKLISENKIEAYCLPQGSIVQLYREIAAKRLGLFTKVGLGTFVDPRIDGGTMNEKTREPINKVVQLEGEEWLFYKPFPIQIALIRGTTVDEKGNLTMEKEGVLTEALALAQATRNSGGLVIVQAEFLAKAGTLHPKGVKVPGILVDYVVLATKQEACWQTEGVYFSPAFAGDTKIPIDSIPRSPLNERKIIARRAAMELLPNSVVNLGIGIPSDIAGIAAEEKIAELMTLTTEIGGIGGVPASSPHFGHSYNGEAVVDHVSQFDFYDGGGIEVAFLGMAQADRQGNVNVSKFKGRAMGCGGFINISQNTPKVVYCGSFTAGKLQIAVGNGELSILQEGRGKKFISEVEQITFSGSYATKTQQQVLYVTERAVFALEEGQLTLMEIAPGVDLHKDILEQMEFTPKISPDLKLMPSGIFQPEWGGLKEYIEGKRKG